mgnify:FL=1
MTDGQIATLLGAAPFLALCAIFLVRLAYEAIAANTPRPAPIKMRRCGPSIGGNNG